MSTEGPFITIATTPGESRVSDPPFDDSTGDVILRSSDGVVFYFHKTLLSLASPVFRDMFALQQNCPGPINYSAGDDGNGAIPMSEDSTTLTHLLMWCHPQTTLSLTKWPEVTNLLEAAEKYDMRGLMKGIEVSIRNGPWIGSVPLRVYAIAIRYHFEELAKAAAKQTLNLTIEERPNVPELRHISASALQNLYDYYCNSVKAAVDVPTNLAWIKPGTVAQLFIAHGQGCPPVTNPTLPSGSSAGSPATASWWSDYLRLSIPALSKRPVGALFHHPTFAGEAIKKANECASCRKTWYTHLTKFNKEFAIEVDRRVAEVSLVMADG
ncbi:hypothetical protein BD779DRAFT_1621574 [Infundibulicybe gibba]|nr:hypothetical protein BD779DRAFT_1621574 [Infundibulicybe gibba]